VATKALLGVVLLCVTTLVGIHTHAQADPLQADPLSGSHHCLLCVTAQLPLAVSACAAAPTPVFTAPVTVTIGDLDTVVEPRHTFSLYTRPPPLF
jgi:hypothetical protein